MKAIEHASRANIRFFAYVQYRQKITLSRCSSTHFELYNIHLTIDLAINNFARTQFLQNISLAIAKHSNDTQCYCLRVMLFLCYFCANILMGTLHEQEAFAAP